MRRYTALVASVSAALLIAGCSSSDDSDHADHTSEASAASTSETATSEPTAASVAAPTVDELTQSLELLVDPQVDAATKAATVENGQARLANLEQMTAALQNYGEITFQVEEPTVEGETATAPVTIATVRGATAPTPNTWVLIDGDWKVSDASACQLLAMGQAPCV
ncbi:hypothetical protein [Rhodococcoides kyotonense]|uniref:Low molecular weight antigen MTB12-like C-terminal domain-containing protein n=1 Tax=Rhodococcoides kyotonense TaxID=398843 RepID=A0A239CJM6_9NOCA|nr:hypothetical protein [Rhodococcus kyotonensis]SNS20377.1 hypothetical protein SAMN05421642_10157 [Rhodococcus kyotonensis]